VSVDAIGHVGIGHAVHSLISWSRRPVPDRQPKEHTGRAASGRSPRTPGYQWKAATKRQPRNNKMPSPGRQISGMARATRSGSVEVVAGLGGAIPSTSPRATRPQHGGKPGEIDRRFGGMLPPHCGWLGSVPSVGARSAETSSILIRWPPNSTMSEQTALRSDNAATTFGGAAVDGPSREVFMHVVAAPVHGR
jgi:hypothetical protein